LSFTSVKSHFTSGNETKDTDIKGYESIDIHGFRNSGYHHIFEKTGFLGGFSLGIYWVSPLQESQYPIMDY
jgi:hypothetical protein